MKKTFYLALCIGLLAIGTSCSKKYDCTCSDNNGAESVTQVRGVNKDAAQVTCVAKTNASTGTVCAIIN